MFHNYLLTALRNIVRHKLYSFITVVGLAVGLACVIFIILFIHDELSFDKWLPGSDNLYRVDVDARRTLGPPIDHIAVVPFPLPAFMKDHLPEVTAMTRLWYTSMTVQSGDRQFLEDVNEADANLFTVLGLPLVVGDPGQVLRRPESIVLSQSLARKYFGDADPVGRILVVSDPVCDGDRSSCPKTAALRVIGVMRDVPYNSQFKIQAVIPHTSPVDRMGEKGKKVWLSFNCNGYVRLTPGSDPSMVAAKLVPIMDRMVDLSTEPGIRQPAGQFMPAELVRLRDAHMNNHNIGVRVPPGSWTTLYGLGAIGLVILLAACFNFTNLATARAMMRAREIGLRKCVGASRRQVATQFLGESILMAVVALVFALALVEILMPAYDAFLGRPIALHYLQDWLLLLIIILVAAAAGLVSGIYPALVLSGFRPITALRSNQSGQAGSGGLRSALVVVQFAVSIALAIVTVVVFSQIDFARNQKLGFRRDNILVIRSGRMTPDAREIFMAQLRAHPGITVASSAFTPFSLGVRTGPVQVPGQSAKPEMEQLQITPEFIDIYGLKLAEGRLLSDKRSEDIVIDSPDAHNDGHNVLINEAAARGLGFTVPGAVGRIIRVDKNNLHIVGVLRDVRFKGARNAVEPTIFFNDRKFSKMVSVRLAGGDVQRMVAFVDNTWHRIMPSAAIQRSFLDDSFEDLYRADVKQGELFAGFVAIAIAISALGLFGLAAFTSESRTKEIGIRKVFGARTRDVAFLLLWQFSIPVLIANLIAWPVAWYYLHGWLQGFAYRIPLSPAYFLGTGFAAVAIAWATVFAHASRVANANPIHALRHE